MVKDKKTGKGLRLHLFLFFLFFSTSLMAAQMLENTAPSQRGKNQSLAQETNKNVIAYTPLLSGVFETDLREKLMQKLQIFQLVQTPPLTIAQLKDRAVTDLKTATLLLQKEGYYDALTDYEIDLKTTPITVNFMVRTGPMYKILKFDLSSNTLDNQLFNALTLDTSQWGMTPGNSATLDSIKDAVKKLFEILTEGGYPYAHVLHEKIVVNHDQKGIVVQLHMDTGKQMRFGDTKINVGAEGDADFIKKRLQWKEGDVYSNMKVIQTIETLNNTQQYAFVKITRPPNPPKDDKMLMTIEAFSKSAKSIAWKLGYDANNQYNFKIGWKGVNTFDDGSFLKVLGGLGRHYNGMSVEHIIPDAWGIESYLTTKLELQRTRTSAYNAMAATVSSSYTTPIIDKLRGSIGLAFKFSANKTRSASLKDHNAPILTVPFSVSYTSLDDLFSPREGWDTLVEVTPAMQIAPQRQFILFKLKQSILHPLTKDHRLVMKAWYKLYSAPSAGRHVLPDDWRFYAGGMGTVRGYGYQMAGKMTADGKPAGGRSLLALGAELNYFVSNDLALGGFFDAGAAYEGRFPNFSNSLFMSVGGGMTYVSPVGDIQLSVGLPLRRRQADKRAQIYVGVGQDF